MSDQRQGTSEHRCSKCNQTFNSSEELHKHYETQHKEQGQGAGQQKGSQAGSNR